MGSLFQCCKQQEEEEFAYSDDIIVTGGKITKLAEQDPDLEPPVIVSSNSYGKQRAAEIIKQNEDEEKDLNGLKKKLLTKLRLNEEQYNINECNISTVRIEEPIIIEEETDNEIFVGDNIASLSQCESNE